MSTNENNVKFAETDDVRNFIKNDITSALNVYAHTCIGNIHMNSGEMGLLADTIEQCQEYLETMIDRLDDYADQIRYLKERSIGWDNDMHRNNDIRFFKP